MQVVYKISLLVGALLLSFANSSNANSQIFFTENKGQWDEQVLFRSSTSEATTWLTNDGIYYQFTKTFQNDNIDSLAGNLYPPKNRLNQVPDSAQVLMVKATFVGASKTVKSSTDGQVQYVCNYFIGDSTRWRTHVPNFSEITYHDLYPGIDLKYYGNGSSLEYDFIVRPGADLSEIKIKFDGVTSLEINNDGELVIGTMWGEFKQKRPIAALASENGSRTVDVYYEFLDDDMIGLATDVTIGDNDLLIVDPVLEFSTVVAGSDDDEINDIKITEDGRLIATGYSTSSDFPGDNVVGVSRYGFGSTIIIGIDPNLNLPVFVTSMGYNSFGSDLEIGENGNIYVAGYSEGFPHVGGTGLPGYSGDGTCFLLKLSSTGDTILFASRFGHGYDWVRDIAIDKFGFIYVCGTTSNGSLCTSLLGEFDEQFAVNAFIIKIDMERSEAVFYHKIGGPGFDYGDGVEVSSDGTVYVSGSGLSGVGVDYLFHNGRTDLLDSNIRGEDAFVVRLSTNGDLLSTTCVGGSGEEMYNPILLGHDSKVYLTGQTFSPDMPMVNAIIDSMIGIGAYLVQLNPACDSLLFSTYVGSRQNQQAWGYDIASDQNGNIALAGWFNGVDFLSQYPLQAYGGVVDGFITVIRPSEQKIVFSTLLGGSQLDWITAIEFDDEGNLIVAGVTKSNDFPVTSPVVGRQGNLDMFISIIAPCCDGQYDVDNDGQLTISDLVFLKDYVLGLTDSSLGCYEESDIDGDGQVHLIDFIYLVDYLFKGGPEPAQCNW